MLFRSRPGVEGAEHGLLREVLEVGVLGVAAVVAGVAVDGHGGGVVEVHGAVGGDGRGRPHRADQHHRLVALGQHKVACGRIDLQRVAFLDLVGVRGQAAQFLVRQLQLGLAVAGNPDRAGQLMGAFIDLVFEVFVQFAQLLLDAFALALLCGS